MECTQRLECTQDLNVSQLPEKLHPEQIGYLGICGEQYPIVKGPNKIGRDPQTCDIVLNLNSISRQHAVINILNQKQYMLMDLKSANKTKLLDKTLPPYIPYPLKNGDTVQFGDVFGIFLLLEDNNDLPETQAIDIPETPVISKHISKVNHATVTMVPESPDVSDRDDSFILASQPKKDHFTSPNKKYIKNSGKTITIQPIGSNKIDNVYWNSSKKSCSINLSLDDSNDCLNNSVNAEAVKNSELESDVNNIHELETQVPYINEIDDATHSTFDKTSCNEDCEAQSIHAMETQIPSAENLPEVCKINEQFEMQCDLYTSNKSNENSIYSAKTEFFQKCDNNTSLNTSKSQTNIKNVIAESDEEILFEEIEDQDKMDNLSSQPLLLPTEPTKNHNDELNVLPLDSPKQEKLASKTSKRKNLIDSDSSTDCDDFDMLSTQKITVKNDNNENVTDSEEPIVDNKIETKACNYQNSNPVIDKASIDDDLTDCEDDLEIDTQNSPKNNSSFENMITQKIVENINLNSDSKSNNSTHNKDEEVDFEDMPTQVITATEDNNFEDQLTQIIPQKTNIMHTNNTCSPDIVSPFKIPLCSPIKINRKDIPRLTTPKPSTSKDSTSTINLSDDDPYYAATQEIFDDLCSQKDSPKNCPTNQNNNNTILNRKGENVNDEMVPCSVEEYELGDRFHHITNEFSPLKKCLVNDKSSESSESEEKVKRYVANLSDKQIRDVVGVECNVKKPVKVSSDQSDLEDTPKKNHPLKFMEIDLPDSQEIKASVSTVSKVLVTESSSESETENNSEECTPILYRHKQKTKKKIDETKVDLTKRFDVETLPTRVIIRNRKPTAKTQSNILKNKLFSEQENDIDSEILVENLSRLRNQNKSNINIKKDEKRYKGANTVQSEVEIEPQKRTKVDLSDKGTKNKSSKRKDGKRTNETNDETSCDLKLVQGDESGNPTDKKKTNKETIINCSDMNSTTKSGDTTIPLNDKVELKETCASDTKRSLRAARTNRKKYENTPEKRTTTKKSANSKKSQTCSEKNKTIEKYLDEEIIKEISSVKSEREETLSLKSIPKESVSKKNVKRSHDSSPEVLVVVRRSKRQKANNKDKKEVQAMVDVKPQKPKSILKNCRSIKNDQSAVYNISSGSNSDSPRSLKRTAADVAAGPSSKRSKTSSASSGNTSIRSTPARNVRTPHVLFTAFPESIIKDVSGKLEKLGAIVVTDVTDCTVLVTQQMKRTFKLLCAVALGRPIVGPNWIQACHDTNMIVDPWLYLMKDEAAEKRFHFNLRRTLVGKRNFLRGYSVSCTPSVRPTAPELKLIVECSGGTWSAEGGGGEGAQRLCVSCAADRALWPALRRRGALLVGTEFILSGVLRQQADVDHYLLK